ncbi:MAG: translation initiation factor IF-2 [Lachnospiraceae bacterium]|nr:translation initiation factor IF-2 [Lachnospiraceae bacterium]
MAKIKVNELAKELGVKNNDLMSYLREKGVDAKSITSMVDDDAIKIAESFFGKRKIKQKPEQKQDSAKSSKLFYKDGTLVRTKDADGNALPITGPVFDEEGNLKKLTLDKNGFRIKPTKDENGNITSAVYSYTSDGRLVRLASKKAEPEKKEAAQKPVEKAKEPAETEKKVEPKEEAPVIVPVTTEAPTEPVKKEIPVEKTEDKPTLKVENKQPEKKPERPAQNRENTFNRNRDGQEGGYNRNRDGQQGGFNRNRDGQQGSFNRGPRDAQQGSFNRGPRDGQQGSFNRGPRDGQQGGFNRGSRDGQQGSFNRGPRDGQQGGFNRGPRDGQQGSFNRGPRDGQQGRDNFGKGSFDKSAGFDKDKDGDTRRTFQRKNDNRKDTSSIKTDFANDINKEHRADAFNNRNRDKNRNRNVEERENEGNKKGMKAKKEDRRGAFIKPEPIPVKKEDPDEVKTIIIPEVITIKDLADKMKQNAAAIVKKLFLSGKICNVNTELPFEEAELLAIEYNCIVEKEQIVDVVEELMRDTEDGEETLVKRPPVVCVMGHVDHGKTSILDKIRSTNVTSREAGGITQHIGAYQVEINDELITFLDTPGHEAFTAMRMRGAMSTDIAVLVVAADDGVMPQTIEAINHAKAAEVPIVVAINKMDKETANPDRVLSELSEHGLVAESWGGDVVTVPVSAKTGEGIEQLLEMILLTAEVQELRANPNRKARGIVVEAKLDKGRGPVATVLMQKGTLHVGENVAIGSSFGKIRAMINDKGQKVTEAGPSTPVEILGLNSVPNAGDTLVATSGEKEAREIAEAFIAQSKEKLILETKSKLSLEGLFDQIKAGNVKELNIIVKADVAGSVEAVKQALTKLSNEEVAVRCIHGGAGNINESDVILASASNAIIIGFNVKPDAVASDTAERENVDIRLYSVIYNAIDDIELAMKGMLDPIYEEVITGHAEIRQIFKASNVGSIAGSYVLDGKITRGSKARITRDGKQIFDGNIASLKRMKDDVKEVAAGYECGILFEKFNEIQEMDQVEIYIMQEVPRK